MEETLLLHPEEDLTGGWADLCASRIAAEGIVALPTETFYGLAADPRSPEAVERLLGLKGYAPGRSVLLLCSSVAQAAGVAHLEDGAGSRLAAACWPGPLTLILPVARGVELAACPDGTVAVRVPDHPIPRRLAEVAGPITGTSANPSALPPACTADGVASYFPVGLAAIVDGGPTPGGEASTLLDLSGPVPRLLRRGPVGPEVLEPVLGARLEGA